MPSSPRVRRHRIALVLAGLHTGASQVVWPAAARRAAARGVDLFIFPGGRIGLEEGHEASRNSMYKLAASARMDGYLVWASSLSGSDSGISLDEFLDPFRSGKVVSLSSGVSRVPIVTIDYYRGMRDAVRHAVHAHGYRKIAFLRGPELHPGAEERYAAYLDVLDESGIPRDPRLVSHPSPWDSGEKAMEELLDGRGLVPGKDFRALVAASDLMALGAVRVMQDRGYLVPEDVAVLGMNDTIESRLASPALTTVQGPFAELAETGVDTLIDLIDGNEVAALTKLPPRLLLRQSCGCPSASLRLAGAGCEAEVRADGDEADHGRPDRGWMERLRDAWRTMLEGDDGSVFLSQTAKLIEQSLREREDVTRWQDAVSRLRMESVRNLDPETRNRMEDVCNRARILLAEGAERLTALHAWEEEKRADELRALDHELLMGFGPGAMAETLRGALPKFGVPRAWICRYEGREDAETVKLEASFENGVAGRPDLSFPGGTILPLEVRPVSRCTCIVEPLFFHDSPIGYAVFEVGPYSGVLYESLRNSVSAAMRASIMFERAEEAREKAEKADGVKTLILSNISQGFKVPLEGIARGLELLASSPSLPDDMRSVVEELRSGALGQGRLLQDLTDLSAAEIDELSLRRQPLDPAPILRRLAGKANGAGNPSRTIRCSISESPSPVLADATRFEQMIEAMIGQVRAVSRNASVTLEAAAVGSELRISVSAEEDRDPSEPLPSENLGFAVARKLALLHSGEIRTLRAPLSGFELTIPLLSREWAAQTGTVPDGEKHPVVVAELGDELSESIRRALDRLPRPVPLFRAARSEDAWARMQESVPRLAVIDSADAGIDAFGLVERMRNDQKLRSVPVLLVIETAPSGKDMVRIETLARVSLQNKGILSSDELAARIVRLADAKDEASAGAGMVVKRTIAYLCGNYARAITRWKLADAANVSEDYLSRVFRRETGLTPWEYLTRLRIRRAKGFLESGNDSIAAVGEAVGFTDQAYFSRVFRRMTGLAPFAYRSSGSRIANPQPQAEGSRIANPQPQAEGSRIANLQPQAEGSQSRISGARQESSL